MSIRGLLVGVALLAVLGGVAWWSESKEKKEAATFGASPTSKDNPKLVSVKDEDVTRLEIVRRDAEPVIAQREKSGWALVSPKPVRTDADAVNGVVSTITGLTWDRLVEDKAADLAAFGLNAPEVKASITGKDGKTITLLVGDDTPTGGGFFAKLDGDPRVFSVVSSVKTGVDKGWRDLRDKRLITLDDTKLSRVELAAVGKGAPVEFGKTGQADWQILKPKPGRADTFRVEDFIRKVRDARLDSDGSDESDKKNAADFASAFRVATVSLTDPSGTQTLEVRKKGEDYFAKSSAVDQVAKVTKELGDGVAKSADDFRQKKLFDFGFAEPSKIEIRDFAGSKFYGFVKGGEKWWADGKEVDATSVQSLIDKLRDVQAVKLTESGFTSPAVEISVTSMDGKRTEKVAISRAASAWFGKREGEATVYEIENAKMEDVLRAAADVKAPPPPPPPPASPAPPKK